MSIAFVLFFIGFGLILYHFVGYYVLLQLLPRSTKQNSSRLSDETEDLPFFSVIITAHNEERTIRRRIENALALDYPPDRFEVILADDWSEDETLNETSIFLTEDRIRYFKPDKHLGKTYAQNGAVKVANGDIIAFSDANAFWNADVLRKFAQAFKDGTIGFVAGALRYTEPNRTSTSKAQQLYWDYELRLRTLESEVKSILTSNGAIYAIRKELYYDADPLFSHDSFMPPYVVSLGKKAVFEGSAVAYERSVKSSRKEFSRKVRMFGRKYKFMFDKGRKRILKKTSFTYKFMYFSHRTLRSFLPLLSAITFVSFVWLMLINIPLYLVFIVLSLLSLITFALPKIRILAIHYLLTMLALIAGFYNYITGKIRPYWEPVDDGR